MSVLGLAEKSAKALWKNSGKIGKAGIGLGVGGAGVYTGWEMLFGDGLEGAAKHMFLSKDSRKVLDEQGAAGLFKKAGFGNKGVDKSLVENASDQVVGEDSTERVGNFIKELPDQVSNAYNGALNGAHAMYDNAREAYNAYNEGQSQQIIDPNAQQQVPQYQQPYPQGAMSGTPTIFSGMDQAVGGMTGGRMNTWDMAQMLLAGYMMFTSRFGMLGKIGGMLTGHHAYQGMQQRNQQQQMMQQPQAAVMQVQGQQQFTPVPASQGYSSAQEYAENATVVSRHR